MKTMKRVISTALLLCMLAALMSVSAFALAGDYVEVNENVYYSVFSTETSVLAPGITQEINYAQSADNKQMVYYIRYIQTRVLFSGSTKRAV